MSRAGDPGRVLDADVWVAVDETAAVATARRRVAALATGLGLHPDRVGEAEIVASELATNLVKHAGGGDLVLRSAGGGLQLVAIDSGPGTRHLASYVDDGVSTAGTLGVGLGAVRRLTGRLDLWSEPGRGAVIAADLGPVDRPAELGHLTRTLRGESVCGDTVAVRETADGWLLLVADGLGHGLLAAEASQRAAEVLAAGTSESPAELIGRMHAALGGSRGAAVAVTRVHLDSRTITHAGVGNVSGRLVGERARTLVSQPGIVGHKLPRVQEVRLPLDDARLVVLHSDGLTEKWRADALPDVTRHGPTVCAAQLLRDAGTRRDDASVLALQVSR